MSMFADKDDLASILSSLAKSLGIDPSMLALDGEIETQSAGRRAAEELVIKFKVYATPQQMSDIDAKLKDPSLVSKMMSDLQSRDPPVETEIKPIVIGAIAGLLPCMYSREKQVQCTVECSSRTLQTLHSGVRICVLDYYVDVV